MSLVQIDTNNLSTPLNYNLSKIYQKLISGKKLTPIGHIAARSVNPSQVTVYIFKCASLPWGGGVIQI